MHAAQRSSARRFPRTDRPLLPLDDVLSVVDSRRATRLELVCWQLNIHESQASPAWELALRERLLQPSGADAFTGQAMFSLTERGRRIVRNRRAGRRRAR